jgi:hypothetical protein
VVDRVVSRSTIAERNSDICVAYQYQSSARSYGYSQRSTKVEWKRYSNQRLNMSKPRLMGQEYGAWYHSVELVFEDFPAHLWVVKTSSVQESITCGSASGLPLYRLSASSTAV